MARRCSICSRPDAGVLNALLGHGRSARSVAVEHGLSEDAMQRHASKHVPRMGDAAQRAARHPTLEVDPRAGTPLGTASDPDATPPDPLDELVEALRTQALAGNPAIVHQYRLALAAQADARHAAPPTRDLATEPEWMALRTRLLRALEPFRAARDAILGALGDQW
jgi:hypothetical protein